MQEKPSGASTTVKPLHDPLSAQVTSQSDASLQFNVKDEQADAGDSALQIKSQSDAELQFKVDPPHAFPEAVAQDRRQFPDPQFLVTPLHA